MGWQYGQMKYKSRSDIVGLLLDAANGVLLKRN